MKILTCNFAPFIFDLIGICLGFFVFRWVQTGSLQADSHISSLSWNLEGTRLLTGGVTIQMWHERITNKDEDPARKL